MRKTAGEEDGLVVMSRTRLQTAKVFHVALDEPLRPLAVEPHYREALIVLTRHGQVLGRVYIPALETIQVDILAAAIVESVGDRLWQREYLETVLEASGRVPPEATDRTVSVVVCTKDRSEVLARCLDSLLALATRPYEIIVVDNCPSDESTRALCERYSVRYVLEDDRPGVSRARNRGIIESAGELVAFTDDDCIVDPHWLDGVGDEFEDPLVMEVTGFVGPAELETRAQYLFERQGGFHRGFERRVFNGAWDDPVTSAGRAGASANAIFRRSAFEHVGLFAEDLGPGTPARSGEDTYANYRILRGGYKIVFDPSRIVWHRHRRDDRGLRTVLFDYAVSSFAYATRCLVKHREASAFRFVRWWWFDHIPHELWAIARRKANRLPLRVVLAEAYGTVVGPWRLRRSVASRRGTPQLQLAELPDEAGERELRVSKEAPRVSVVIPSHNRRDSLGRVLDGLAAQTYSADSIEAVVVLDGCSDGTAEMLRSAKWPFDLRVSEGSHAGIAAVRNVGLSAARNDVILFLDDDIVPGRDCVTAHASAHESRRNHVALGYCPPVVDDGGWWAYVLRSWWEDHFRRKREPQHTWTYMDLTTGNSSLPRSLLLDFGGFDEDFTKRHEDWELGVRMLERGIVLAYYPDAIARHYLDTSLRATVRNQRQEARDDVLLARKHPHVMSQLPLAQYVDGRPSASERFVERYVPLADRLETLGMRGTWQRLARRLVREAYVLGLKDAVPAAEEFFSILAPIWASAQKVTWSLDEHAMGHIAPVGSAELAIEWGGEAVGRVVAVDPGEHWDWRSVGERVARETAQSARVVSLCEFLELREAGLGALAHLEPMHVR